MYKLFSKNMLSYNLNKNVICFILKEMNRFKKNIERIYVSNIKTKFIFVKRQWFPRARNLLFNDTELL